jgi:hypothetical protein
MKPTAKRWATQPEFLGPKERIHEIGHTLTGVAQVGHPGVPHSRQAVGYRGSSLPARFGAC